MAIKRLYKWWTLGFLLPGYEATQRHDDHFVGGEDGVFGTSSLEPRSGFKAVVLLITACHLKQVVAVCILSTLPPSILASFPGAQ